MNGAAPAEHIRLPDGRGLAYLELGDPKGRPVLYCHGFPSCRLEARFAHRAALRAGLRLISPDRPGMGRSELQPGRRLLDWPDDLAALADRLGLDEFGVLGVSGGGPYALACSTRLGPRVRALCLVCPLGPVSEAGGTSGMRAPTSLALGLARRAPTLSRALHTLVTAPVLGRLPGLVVQLLGGSAGASDRRVLAEPGVRAWLTENVVETLRHGGAGAALDLELLAGDWGFRPEEVRTPVRLWHGDADPVIPAGLARRLGGRLPRARIRILPGEGHYSLPVGHAGEILADLASTMEAAPRPGEGAEAAEAAGPAHAG